MASIRSVPFIFFLLFSCFLPSLQMQLLIQHDAAIVFHLRLAISCRFMLMLTANWNIRQMNTKWKPVNAEYFGDDFVGMMRRAWKCVREWKALMLSGAWRVEERNTIQCSSWVKARSGKFELEYGNVAEGEDWEEYYWKESSPEEDRKECESNSSIA